MSVIDVDSLLQEISPDSVCGENLEYDPAFAEMERTAQGRPEQQMGDSVVEAEEPDWRAVKRSTIELFARTKDIRIGVYLTRALIQTDGWPGFRDGLKVLHGLLEKYWEPMHPLLDPDDNNDPTLRVNSLASLFDAETTLKTLREAPLVAVKTMGRFSLRDVEVASGTVPAPPGGDAPPPEMATIDGAFMEVEVAELEATAAAAREARDLVGAIDQKLTELVGAGQAADFSPLLTEARSAVAILDDRLARRGVGEGAEGGAEGGGGGPGQRFSGDITSREDVVRALDRICDYYARYEPSSPLPLLLQRAKRLVPKSFFEIVQDLAPSGAAEIQALGGLDREQ